MSNNLPSGWEKRECRSQPGLHYFYYSPLGICQWNRPGSNEKVNGKRRRVDVMDGSKENDKGNLAKVAIIVPFRDLDKEQNRQGHLNIFIPSLTAFLKDTEHPFCIYIIEQSNDNRKFNRGKLLNIGFDYAIQGKYSLLQSTLVYSVVFV